MVSLYDGDTWCHIQGFSILGHYKDIKQAIEYTEQERTWKNLNQRNTDTSDYMVGQISDLFSNYINIKSITSFFPNK